jgi:hypothetical protein
MSEENLLLPLGTGRDILSCDPPSTLRALDIDLYLPKFPPEVNHFSKIHKRPWDENLLVSYSVPALRTYIKHGEAGFLCIFT